MLHRGTKRTLIGSTDLGRVTVALGGAVENAPSHQARDKIDHKQGRAPTFIEKGIEFDQVDAADEAAIVKDLHDEMRLAEGRAARNGGPDAGRDPRVK